MIVQDSRGNEVEISVYGDYDDVQVEEAYYTEMDGIVSDDEIEYILDNYAESIYEELAERAMSKAEDYYDMMRDK